MAAREPAEISCYLSLVFAEQTSLVFAANRAFGVLPSKPVHAVLRLDAEIRLTVVCSSLSVSERIGLKVNCVFGSPKGASFWRGESWCEWPRDRFRMTANTQLEVVAESAMPLKKTEGV